LKDGPKRLPEWHDKLDEVAREMAAESGKELPDDFSLQREPADSFDWETGEDIPPPGKKSLAKKPRVTAKEKAAKARVRVQTAVASLKESFAALKQVGAVFDPMAEAEKQVKFLADLREVGLAYVELGVRSFNAAVARLAADLGHMSEGLRRHFEGEWRNLLGEGMVRSPVRDPSDTNELGRYARKITRWVVESGVQDREAVVDEVHRELETVKPGITRREAMDAMSGYGDFKELTKDEISKTVRAIKGQLQQLAKVQDLQSAIAESKKWLASGMSPEEAARKLEESGLLPKKTGFERRTPDDIERQLIAQVNELKKEVPVSVEAGEGQLKSALDAAKTAVRNRITDLEQEIATREKIVKTRTTLKPDVELTALRKQRNQLWEAHNKIFPRTKKTVTPEQQLAATGRALDRAIDQLAAELEAGRIGRKPLLPRRTSPEIEAKRSKLEGLRAQREELRTHDPAYQASEDARLLAAKKRELTGRLAELEDRLARKDFAKKPLRRTPEDAESLAMRHKVDAARKKVRAEVDKIARANRPTWKKALGVPVEVARAIKSIWASIDFSALGRQGGWLAASHPIKAARAQARSFRAALSDKEAFAIMEGISLRPNAKSGLYERAGLELTDISGAIVSREEMYQSTWAEHIPIVKYGVKASERAYVSQLNQQRADVFDAMVATMTRDPANVTDAEARVIANYVNVASWRGDVGRYEQAAASLGAVLWTPRGYVSRFELLIGQPLWKDAGKASWRVRRVIAREYGRSLAGLSVFYATAAAFLYATFGPPSDDEEGWSISLDPYSADLGKFRFGPTRIDPLGGLSQTARLMTRLSTNTINGLRQAMGGEVTKEGKAEMKQSLPVVGRFLKAKLAPAFSMVSDVLTGEDYERQPVTPGGLAAKAITPLNIRDIYEGMRDHGVPEGAALGILSTFGMGLQSQPEKPPKAKPKGRTGKWYK